MNSKDFNTILDNRIEKIKKVLGSKSEEYAINGDKLHNFKVAARIGNESMEQALEGMMRKHLVSVYDLINGNFKNDHVVRQEHLINEKVGDLINYLILLEAIMMDNLGKEQQ